MAKPTYLPGQFCWNELGTRDVAAAKKFYVDVIGWKLFDKPMPGGMGTYTHCQVDDQDVAGMYELGPEMPANMPSMWTGSHVVS